MGTRRSPRLCGRSSDLERDGDGLDLEVGVEVRVALLAADARRLVAAEGRRRVAGAPGVDVDGARLQQRGELVGAWRCRGSRRRRRGRTRCRWRARATSSRSSNGIATSTGPKISSRAIFMSSVDAGEQRWARRSSRRSPSSGRRRRRPARRPPSGRSRCSRVTRSNCSSRDQRARTRCRGRGPGRPWPRWRTRRGRSITSSKQRRAGRTGASRRCRPGRSSK